jgi:hypothetical protein
LDKRIELIENGINTGNIPLVFQRGSRYVYPIDYKAVTELHSNFINDTTTKRLYFASKDSLTCLDYQGQEVWTYPFPQDYGSTSKLVLQDNLIYLVNNGSIYFRLSKINYGRAFVIAFNKTDGTKKWMTTFQEKDMIEDIRLKTNGLYLLFKDKISVCSLESGHLFQTERLPWSSLPSFSFFLSYPVEERITENQYKSIDIMDTTKHYINLLGNLGVLDTRFKLERTIQNQDCYAASQLSDYRFITNINHVLMFNKKNQLVARLKYIPQYYFMGSFYVQEANQIIEIKLKDILD